MYGNPPRSIRREITDLETKVDCPTCNRPAGHACILKIWTTAPDHVDAEHAEVPHNKRRIAAEAA